MDSSRHIRQLEEKIDVLETRVRHLTNDLNLTRRELETSAAKYFEIYSHMERMVDARTREMNALKEKLARSEKMEAIGLLAGGVAHDLNNILNGIVGYPDLILMDLPAQSPKRKWIEAIKKSGQKAAAIVQDMLTLARRGAAQRELVCINDLIQDYLNSPEQEKLALFHPQMRIETQLAEDLLPVRCSAVHLSKSFMNLVSNAAEAMPEGGVIHIRTLNRYVDEPIQGYETIAKGEYAVIEIRDTGTGITEAELKRIFEPFYTKKIMGRSGTGLGMAVVWGTVKDHDGFIDVDSTTGQGTLFRIYFPACRETVSRPLAEHPAAVVKGFGERILVVDDVAEQRDIAQEMLTRLNYEVVTRASGEQALAYLKTNRADLIVLDMIMDPGIDGLETYQRIIKTRPGQKAILASGFSETDRVKKAQALGAGRYLPKPYLFEKIALAVREELDRTC